MLQNITYLPDISYRAFQHPDDAKALSAMRNMKMLTIPIKQIHGWFNELFFRIKVVPNCIEVNSQQYPSLWKKYIQLTEVISIYPAPKLYINTSPTLNAITTGTNNPCIMLFSGLIDLLSEDELLAVLGHELGHVKCQHLLYSSLAELILMLGAEAFNSIIPGIGSLFQIPVVYVLLDWYRKAELSCDRAALLTTQDEDIVCSALAKLAGYSKNLKDEINLQAVKEQAFEHENIGENSRIEQALKVFFMMQETHPHPVTRVRELSNWAISQDYYSILDGNYEKMDVSDLLYS